MEADAEGKVPASAQITKIKIGKDEKNATILYQKNGSKASKEVTFRGYDDALDDFIIDFRGMSKHIIETLNFPEEWLSRMTTTGLSCMIALLPFSANKIPILRSATSCILCSQLPERLQRADHFFRGNAVGNTEMSGTAKADAGHQQQIVLFGLFTEGHIIGLQGSGEHVKSPAWLHTGEAESRQFSI